MEDFVNQSLMRVSRAAEISTNLFQLCIEHAIAEDPSLLTQAGILLGEFANNLRSALNYTSRTYIEREVLKKTTAKREKWMRYLDFPYASSKEEFDKKPICKATKDVSESLYMTFLQFQPFYHDNEWLADLMTLSNQDKHVVINSVLSPTASMFLALLPNGTQLKQPVFMGDKLIVFDDQGPVATNLPFYYAPLKAIATPRKTWSLYLVPLLPHFSLDLINFTATTPFKVTQILAVLNSRFGEHNPHAPAKS